MAFQRAFDLRTVTHEEEIELLVLAAGEGCTLDHDAHAFIAAHRVNGDTRQAHINLRTWSIATVRDRRR